MSHLGHLGSTRAAVLIARSFLKGYRVLHCIAILLAVPPTLRADEPLAPPAPPAAPPVAASTTTPRLLGSWTLNQQLTQSVMRSESGDSAGGRHSGGWGGHHGGGGGHGGSRGGGQPSEGSERPDDSAAADGGDSHHSSGGYSGGNRIADELSFILKDGAIVASDPSGRARTFHPDGKAVHDDAAPHGPVDVTSTWDKDGDLVVTTVSDKGPKRIETYIVDHERKHLYVTVEISGWGSNTRKMTRAYDPADEAPAATP